MPYNPATDFLGLWRNNGADVSKLEMPGLDYVVAALDRAGVLNLDVSATPPVANQDVTAWLQTAVPSSSGEGTLYLWNAAASAYEPATPALFLRMLEASAGQSGVSWWTSMGGPPANTVGNDGDFDIQLDGVGGIYGPKAAGAWPAVPIAGTTNTIDQSALDNTFGTATGTLITRDGAAWGALAPGAVNQLFVGTGGVPAYVAASVFLDAIFGTVQGSILFRGPTVWDDLPPGTAGQVLSSGGAGADPLWDSRTAEFPPGTRMIFQQSAAPTGWTKDVSVNDYGLRVVSGSVGITPGTAFSTVFAQTSVGNTTLTQGQIPPHSHPYTRPDGGINVDLGAFTVVSSTAADSTSNTGGGNSHTHSIALNLSYLDVIIAGKN